METGELLGMLPDHSKAWESVGAGLAAAGSMKLLGVISTAEWQSIFNAISTGILLVGGALVLVYQQTSKARRSERLADEEQRKASLSAKVEDLSRELAETRDSLKGASVEREMLRGRCDRLSETLLELTEKLPEIVCKHPLKGRGRCEDESQ
jgi:hypothetical protein